MSYETAEFEPGEEEALEALANSPDPMTKVIYHMSMRQLATTERLLRIEEELMVQGGNQRRLVEFLERRWGANGGSVPNLHAMVFGGG